VLLKNGPKTPANRFRALKADEGTRTLDLLHGKCQRPFASVRTRSLKRAGCRGSVQVSEREQTRANTEPCHSCHGVWRRTRTQRASSAGRRAPDPGYAGIPASSHRRKRPTCSSGQAWLHGIEPFSSRSRMVCECSATSSRAQRSNLATPSIAPRSLSLSGWTQWPLRRRGDPRERWPSHAAPIGEVGSPHVKLIDGTVRPSERSATRSSVAESTGVRERHRRACLPPGELSWRNGRGGCGWWARTEAMIPDPKSGLERLADVTAARPCFIWKTSA